MHVHTTFFSLLAFGISYALLIEGQLQKTSTISGAKGSTIITNYYDPNAGPDVGPGLPPSPLERGYPPIDGYAQDNYLQDGYLQDGYLQDGYVPLLPSASENYLAPLGPYSNYITPTDVPYSPFGGDPGSLGGLPISPLEYRFSQPIGTSAASAAERAPATGGIQVRGPRVESEFYDQPTYSFPGLVAKVAGRWVGSDYLYDLPPNIGVLVEIVKPESVKLKVGIAQITEQTEGIFARRGINPQAEASFYHPPLPFFHILVLFYPSEEGYVAAVSGRLFEQVTLPRLKFVPAGTWQAITWEKQELIITSPAQFDEQLLKITREIARAFVNRVDYFAREKVFQESEIKLKEPGSIPRVKRDEINIERIPEKERLRDCKKCNNCR